MLEYEPLASLWYPPAAVAFAAFAVFRWRALPPLLLASIVASWSTFERADMQVGTAQVLLNAALYGAVHCLAYWFAAEAVLRSIPNRSPPSMPRSVAAFLLAGMLASAMAAVGGSWVTAFVGLMPRHEMWPMVLPWLIGDYVGLLTMGPLLLLALRTVAERLNIPFSERLFAFDDLPRPQRSPRSFALKLLLVLGAVVVSLLAIAQAPHNEPLMFIIFVAVVLQLWIVHSQGLIESLISIALFSLAVVVMVYALGLGQVALTLQFAMITLATGSYFGLTVPVLYADNTQLRRLLIHDALTGAYTRHFFVDLSQQAIRQSRANGQPTSMLMIDMDHLKSINDRHGHGAGDRALIAMARLCRQSLGSGALFGRLGGDEFCALLPGVDDRAAADIAQRLVDVVSAFRFETGAEIRPSISVGIATTRDGDEDYDSLWLRADSALYVAKRNGRNRIAQEEG